MSTRRPMHADHHQRGFTLSEILVTTAIFAIIMIAALAVYDQSNRVFKGSTEAADMQQSTRIGFDKLVSDIRMAGFDYNRGGIPSNPWEAAQPDEQVEYAGNSVVAFRSNFNYNTALTAGNGLETALTPKNTDGLNIFPYVTTNNSEIVLYALRSTDATKNTDKISFYVDDYSPRSVFPSAISPGPASGTTSKKEHLLILGPTTCATCGLDTTNANPPYTLYRISVADVLAGTMGTPVAENIRSLNFTYYQDVTGKTLLTNADGSAITTGKNAEAGSTFPVSNTGAIGGAGMYDPDNVGTTTDFPDRDRRSFIQAIRIDLVGMNASPDLQGYTNPTETVSAIKGYRQYALSSLIVPRNLGKTGFPEPVYAPPGPPTISGMCTGFCGAPVIYWTAPTGGGPVEKYEVSWDTSGSGSFGSPHVLNVIDPSATSAILPDFGTENLAVPWYYRIAAINANGSSAYSSLYTVTPKNNTKPSAPSTFSGTDTGTANAQANQVTLTWTSPTTNATPKDVLACSGTGGSTSGATIPSEEIIGYKIYRATTEFFDASTAQVVLDYTSSSQPARGVPGSIVTWVDNVANDAISGPANCVQYYYRIEAANRCQANGTYNTSGSASDAISAVYPAFGTAAKKGSANGGGTPSAPIALAVDGTSACPGPGPLAPTYCQIKLNWPRVTTDTASNTIGVDTYRITRKVKHQNNVPTPLYALDTTFGTGGYLEVSGYSQLSGGTLSYTDNTATVKDGSGIWAGLQNSYEYTVEAKSCTNYSVLSPAAQFPSSCTGAPTIDQTGYAGSGTGDQPSSPYVLNTGDQVRVTPPSGVTYTSVTYNVYTYPGGTLAAGPTAGILSAGKYVFNWSDLVSDATYMMTIVTTDTTGCSSTYIKYITQQTIAPCAFGNLTTLPAAASGSGTTGKNNEFITFPVTVTGTDTLSFTSRNVRVTWNDPRTPPSGKTYITSLDALQWTVTASSSTDTFTTTAINTSCCPLVSAADQLTTRNIPASLPGALPGSPVASKGFTLRVQMSHPNSGGERDFADATVNPTAKSAVKKICISYTIPSEPGVTKRCNLVGQAGSTANPVNCD